MSVARIYQPSKTATQSGRRNTECWLLEFEPDAPRFHDPLMGWIGTTDPESQVRLRFASREEAIAFAERNGLTCMVQQPKERRIKPKSYADNFRYHQGGPSTGRSARSSAG